MANRRQKLAPLTWKRHAITPSSANALRTLTQSIQERLALAAFEAPPPSALPKHIWLPNLPDDPTAKAIRLLQAAAEIEHALMVQYLYAGYGFRNSPNREILGIAIEEMSHLMTVQNLLRFVGGEPHLARQDFGPSSQEESLFPFELLLEPISHLSLAKYVVAESPENLPAGVNPVVMSHIVEVATQGAGDKVGRVGNLYALLGAVFSSEQLLLQKAATGDPWYVIVNGLATEAAAFYGGRDKLHLPDGAFLAASVAIQGSDQDWDRSVVNDIDEFRVHVVAQREEAVEAIRDIGLQGEGPTSIATETSHFKRFFDLFLNFFGVDGLGTNPAPGVAAVPAAAVIVVDENSTDPISISHPDSVRWARLADLRYGILLGSLEMYLRTPPAEREFLRGWCFAEMFAISKLAQFLTRLPRSTATTPTVAAIPFNLPDWSGDVAAWQDLVDCFTASTALIGQLKPTVASGGEQARVLHLLASSDERKLAEATARITGASVLTKADKARDILDWAAGAGDPKSHSGASPSFPQGNQGRFWNLSLNEFKQTKIFGTNIVNIPAGGGDALLIEVLRDESMPSGRPSLPINSPEFQFLEQWVSDGCPEN